MDATLQYAVSAPLEPGELGALLGSVGWGPYPPPKLERIIAGSTAYVTARETGRLVGFGRLLTDGGVLGWMSQFCETGIYPFYPRPSCSSPSKKRLGASARSVPACRQHPWLFSTGMNRMDGDKKG